MLSDMYPLLGNSRGSIRIISTVSKASSITQTDVLFFALIFKGATYNMGANVFRGGGDLRHGTETFVTSLSPPARDCISCGGGFWQGGGSIS